jgi:hypothetical protein
LPQESGGRQAKPIDRKEIFIPSLALSEKRRDKQNKKKPQSCGFSWIPQRPEVTHSSSGVSENFLADVRVFFGLSSPSLSLAAFFEALLSFS